MHLDGTVTLLVSIPGCPPRRVKFCVFDDECHHTEHMIINTTEFPEYTAPQRPRDETPENVIPPAMTDHLPSVRFGQHEGKLTRLRAVPASCTDLSETPCGPTPDHEGCLPPGLTPATTTTYDTSILDSPSKGVFAAELIWVWTLVVPPEATGTPRETRLRSRNSMASGGDGSDPLQSRRASSGNDSAPDTDEPRARGRPTAQPSQMPEDIKAGQAEAKERKENDLHETAHTTEQDQTQDAPQAPYAPAAAESSSPGQPAYEDAQEEVQEAPDG